MWKIYVPQPVPWCEYVWNVLNCLKYAFLDSLKKKNPRDYSWWYSLKEETKESMLAENGNSVQTYRSLIHCEILPNPNVHHSFCHLIFGCRNKNNVWIEFRLMQQINRLKGNTFITPVNFAVIKQINYNVNMRVTWHWQSINAVLPVAIISLIAANLMP